jgi:hypothetical protein
MLSTRNCVCQYYKYDFCQEVFVVGNTARFTKLYFRNIKSNGMHVQRNRAPFISLVLKSYVLVSHIIQFRML